MAICHDPITWSVQCKGGVHKTQQTHSGICSLGISILRMKDVTEDKSGKDFILSGLLRVCEFIFSRIVENSDNKGN